jgi:hypothetical protein
MVLLDHVVEILYAPQLVIGGQYFLLNRGGERFRSWTVAKGWRRVGDGGHTALVARPRALS